VKRGFEIRFKDGLRCASDQATSLARGAVRNTPISGLAGSRRSSNHRSDSPRSLPEDIDCRTFEQIVNLRRDLAPHPMGAN